LRIGSLELHHTVSVHAGMHVEHDFEWNTSRLNAEVHDVLYSATAGDWTSRHIRRDSDEYVPRKKRLEARAPAHEWEERKKVLAAKIELDPPLRARLCVNELPGSIAERRHVGVVHVSDFIHNEGNVQSVVERGASRSPSNHLEGTWRATRVKKF
jgi:hypothetical protein